MISHRFAIETHWISHIGRGRKNQQDNFYISGGTVLTTEQQLQMQEKKIPNLYIKKYYENVYKHLFAISDGMGGHSHGEIASLRVVEGLAKYEETIQRESHELLIGKKQCIDQFQSTIHEINTQLLWQTNTLHNSRGMGATLSGILLLDDEAVVFNIGDSSTFLMANRKLTKLTREHNEGQLLVDAGQISATDYEVLAKRRRLTKYFGLDEKYGLLTATLSQPIKLRGDMLFLICSDGLTDAIEVAQIESICHEGKDDLSQLCHTLVKTIMTQNTTSQDNITIGLVAVKKRKKCLRKWFKSRCIKWKSMYMNKMVLHDK